MMNWNICVGMSLFEKETESKESMLKPFGF
jgi:hypothetical protein